MKTDDTAPDKKSSGAGLELVANPNSKKTVSKSKEADLTNTGELETAEAPVNYKSPPRKLNGKATRKKRRNRWTWPLVVLVVVAGGAGVFAWFSLNQSSTVKIPQTSTVSSQSVVGLTLAATGQVAAKADLALTFSSGGTLTEILVKQGDTVTKGQAIAKIDDTDLKNSLKTAQSNLASAKASLDKLKAGATESELLSAQEQLKQAQIKVQTVKSGNSLPTDIQSAQSQLASAIAKQEKDKQGGTDAEKASAQASVDSAQANLESAQAKLNTLLAGPDAATLSAAQLTYDQAVTNLEKTKSSLNVSLVNAQVSRDQALTALNRAQDAYSTQYNNDHNADGTLKSSVKDSDIQNETNLYRALQDAQGNYNKADVSLNDAKVSYDTGLRNAQANLDNAKIQLDKTKAGATESDLASARASVNSAEANLNNAKSTLANLTPTATTLASDQASVDSARANLAKLTSGGTQSDIETAESNLRIQEQTLKTLQGGPTASELAVSEAQYQTAQANLDKAQVSLDGATLKAPFDGIISSMTVITGQTVGASTTIAQLVDNSQLHVDVSVGESDIAKVSLNQAVTLSFDAISGVSFTGKVTFISPKSTVTSNVVSYLVTVTMDDTGKNSLQDVFPDEYQKFQAQLRPAGAPSGSASGAPAGTPGAQGAPSGTPPAGMPGGQDAGAPAAQSGQTQVSQTRPTSGSVPSSSAGAIRSTSFCGYTPSFGSTTSKPKVGMTATVTVCRDVKAGVMSVPSRAIKSKVENGSRVSYVEVLVDNTKGTTAQRTVTTGLVGDSSTVVTSNDLKDGDKVVVSTASSGSSSSSNSTNNTNLFGGGAGGGPAGGPPGP